MKQPLTEERLLFWALKLLAAIVMLCGLLMAAGGAWLIALDGSWYYLLTGTGLTAAGVLLYAQRMLGVWLYWVVFLASAVWAMVDVGLDFQVLIPRVAALGVIAVLTLCFIPIISRGKPNRA